MRPGPNGGSYAITLSRVGLRGTHHSIKAAPFEFALWLPCHYLWAMPPRRKDTPAKLAARMRSWRVTILRNKALFLGTVHAPDERAAEAAAAVRFGLNDEQRKRIAVQEVDAS